MNAVFPRHMVCLAEVLEVLTREEKETVVSILRKLSGQTK